MTDKMLEGFENCSLHDGYGDDRQLEENRKWFMAGWQAAQAEQSAELERLRKDAERLQKDAERMQKALSDIAEWTERYTTPGHPISNIARAAIAAEGEKK